MNNEAPMWALSNRFDAPAIKVCKPSTDVVRYNSLQHTRVRYCPFVMQLDLSNKQED